MSGFDRHEPRIRWLTQAPARIFAGGRNVGQRYAKLTLRDPVVIAVSQSKCAQIDAVIVEFLDGAGQWQMVHGAAVARLQPGVYEIRIAGLAVMWTSMPSLFNGMVLRLDGRDSKPIVGAQCQDDVLVMKAFVEKSSPEA